MNTHQIRGFGMIASQESTSPESESTGSSPPVKTYYAKDLQASNSNGVNDLWSRNH